MKYLAQILYGIIIGNWLMNLKSRIAPGKVPGRYAVIAENCMLNGYFVFLGTCDTWDKASAAREAVEDSAAYIADIYDKMDPDDNKFITGDNFIPWNELIQADQDDLKHARSLCSGR
jgi:hypothetical protein